MVSTDFYKNDAQIGREIDDIKCEPAQKIMTK